MKRVLILLGFCLPVACAHAHTDAPGAFRFEQRLEAPLPLALQFTDETGRTGALGDRIKQVPLVMVLGYLRCPNLCATTLAGMTEALTRSGLRADRDYRALFVSIDPRDQPSDAAAAKTERIPPAQRAAWRFLTGTNASIAPLAQALGFHYSYDARRQEYAHPAGFVVVTPAGAIARYFPGVRFDPRELRSAQADAAQGRAGTFAGELLLLCHQLDPAGRYTATILNALRAAIGLFLVVGAVFLWRMRRP